MPKKIEKILIIKMFGLGSMILMTPMIRSIRNSYPQAKLYFMTFKGSEDIGRCYKMCDEVISVRRDNFWHFCTDSLKNIKFIDREEIDVLIDAEFFSRYTALFCSLCEKSFLIGFFNRNMYRGRFLDKRCYFNQYYHMKQNFMELANAFCRSYEDLTVTTPEISDKIQERIAKLIKESGFSNHPMVILNPNTSNITPYINRSWPLKYFAKVGQYLLKKGYSIVVIGDSRQVRRSNLLCKRCGEGSISLAGKTNLEELLALIKEAFCVITNDSLPLHIAVSQNIPTTAFFGTDTPILYGYQDPIHTTFFKKLPCSPCLSVFNYKRGKCEFNSRCVRTIAYRDVISEFEKKEELLKREYDKRKRKSH